jgi:hypothetical protein
MNYTTNFPYLNSDEEDDNLVEYDEDGEVIIKKPEPQDIGFPPFGQPFPYVPGDPFW